MLKTEVFNIRTAHAMVKNQQALGNDVRWDGWDIVFHRTPRPQDAEPLLSSFGARRNGEWGFENRFEVNSDGKWIIDARNLRRIRRSRN